MFDNPGISFVVQNEIQIFVVYEFSVFSAVAAFLEFVRNGNKNKLTADNQQRILDAYAERKDIEHFVRLVDAEEIAGNGYNIAVSSYVAQKDEREAVDIVRLNAEIAGIVERQAALRTQIDAIVAELEG